MKDYNTAFFSLYENWFKILQEEFGSDTALQLFAKVMAKGLSAAYGNNFQKGKATEFSRLVGERDFNVGLLVKFPLVKENKIIYQFHTDPFPNLKNQIDHYRLDETFIPFKISHILGEEWQYQNISHIWKGDSFTEFVIWK